MSCDKLVYDLSNQIEGSPNIFIRKDWLNILDNQNQNYQNNQSIVDTSQLSNSNKWMSYREGYLLMPMLLTLWGAREQGVIPYSRQNKTIVNATATARAAFSPVVNNQQANVSNIVGLKNWFGSIIHSFTLDYNGTTIIQQTPFVNMWNSFRLLTTLSWNDIITQGPTIGFYPDTPQAFGFGVDAPNGILAPLGTYNNNVMGATVGQKINVGFKERLSWINFGTLDTLGPTVYPIDYGPAVNVGALEKNGGGDGQLGATYLSVGGSCGQLWRTFISDYKDSSANSAGGLQISVSAIIYLKHVHPFFNMCPLLKGVFMKMTMNLNNASCAFKINGANDRERTINLTSAPQVPVGGVNPIMLSNFNTEASLYTIGNARFGAAPVANTDYPLSYIAQTGAAPNLIPANVFGVDNFGLTYLPNGDYFVDLSVGSVPVSSTFQSNYGLSAGFANGRGSKSVYLYVPAYTFNPVFEQAYLSSPIKQIKYTDIYQYQVKNIQPTDQFNNLVTNGIANIKSVLLIPFYSPSNAGIIAANGVPVYQSPFDPAGTGNTSPLCHFNNFNVQISGQNAIYNTQRYTFEQFVNQLYGQNAVNGGLTDGLTSGLIDFQGFTTSQCFYYINVERMLPVEQSVPKSVQILGTNQSNKIIDIMVFVEYGTEISIDALTGARV